MRGDNKTEPLTDAPVSLHSSNSTNSATSPPDLNMGDKIHRHHQNYSDLIRNLASKYAAAAAASNNGKQWVLSKHYISSQKACQNFLRIKSSNSRLGQRVFAKILCPPIKLIKGSLLIIFDSALQWRKKFHLPVRMVLNQPLEETIRMAPPL